MNPRKKKRFRREKYIFRWNATRLKDKCTYISANKLISVQGKKNQSRTIYYILKLLPIDISNQSNNKKNITVNNTKVYVTRKKKFLINDRILLKTKDNYHCEVTFVFRFAEQYTITNQRNYTFRLCQTIFRMNPIVSVNVFSYIFFSIFL